MRIPLAAALLLAGCLAPAADDVPAGPRASLAFSAPVRLPGDQVSAEPNLATGPDGAVWVVAPGSVIEAPNVRTSQVSLWASFDAGVSWEAQRAPAPREERSPWCSCDADVERGPDGTLYLTDFWVTPALNGFTVEASVDDGRTWEERAFVTATNLVANDRQYLTAGTRAGELYLSYARGTAADPLDGRQPDAGLHLLRSDDGGRTFARMAQPFRDTGSADAFIAKPRVAADGTLHYPWVEFPSDDPWNGASTVVVATSRDGGATFERAEVAAVPHGTGGLWPLAADVGPDGLLHLVWMERQPGGGSVLRYASSADGARTFSAPRLVGWPGGTAVLPWIAAAGEGRAVVAFYGAPDSVEPEKAAPDQRWDAWALVVGDGVDDAPARVSPWPVKVGTFCPRGAACPQDRELLDYPGVAWREGRVHVAFAASLLDEGAGPEARAGPEGGHSTMARVWHAGAELT